MEERIKKYYEYLKLNSPQFREFLAENQELNSKEIATKYNIEIKEEA